MLSNSFKIKYNEKLGISSYTYSLFIFGFLFKTRLKLILTLQIFDRIFENKFSFEVKLFEH